MISNNSSVLEVLEKIKKDGFKTMQDNGMEMVKNGTTTLGEYYSKI